MEAVIARLVEEVKPVCLGCKFYSGKSILRHVLAVAGIAKDLAMKIGADRFIAEAGGVLHDIGSAMYGKKDHHITGVREAAPVLLRCGCPLEFVGPILSAIYSHRGSQRIPFRTQEAKCVAAADSIDHFNVVPELWRIQVEEKHVLELEVYKTLSEKLANDWEKIDPEIKFLLDGTYGRARQELLAIASQIGKPKKVRRS